MFISVDRYIGVPAVSPFLGIPDNHSGLRRCIELVTGSSSLVLGCSIPLEAPLCGHVNKQLPCKNHEQLLAVKILLPEGVTVRVVLVQWYLNDGTFHWQPWIVDILCRYVSIHYVFISISSSKMAKSNSKISQSCFKVGVKSISWDGASWNTPKSEL